MLQNDNSAGKITFQESGNHHQSLLNIDPQTGKVFGGTVLNYSNNSSIGFAIDNEGKTSSTIVHSGDTHAFFATASSDGAFAGQYTDKATGIDLSMSGDMVALVKGKIPAMGLVQEGDHHRTILNINEDGKLSGVLESHSTDNNNFKVEIRDGKIASGLFIHTGENHNTNIALNQEGWKATINGGSGNSRWAVGVEKGNADVRVSGNLNLKF